MAETNNLALWQAVEKTPLEETKKITGKAYQGTSPKPHYLVRKATETFGPCGIGWGFTIEDERIEEGAGGAKMHIARVKVWFKWDGERGEVEHIGGTQFSGVRSNGNAFTDEDAPKKSVTDALVKALSMIGFAGDIFMGRYDDSKYLAELRDEASGKPKPDEPKDKEERSPFDATSNREAYIIMAEQVIDTFAGSADALRAWWKEEADHRRVNKLTKADVDDLSARAKARIGQLERPANLIMAG